MDEPIEEVYFKWLYSKVAYNIAPSSPSNTYYTLMRDLHSTEFVWLVSGDDNRAEEGMDLRKRFCLESGIEAYPPWLNIPCSVLEMMIAFSERAAFDTESLARDWFWIFLQNLGLSEMSDNTLGITTRSNEILETFVWRTYGYQGDGGMFPMLNPPRDQHTLELWYQFCDYLVENELD